MIPEKSKEEAQLMFDKLNKKTFTKTQLALMKEIGKKMKQLRKSGVHVYCNEGRCNATRITTEEYYELMDIIGEDIESEISANLETITFCEIDDCGAY